MESESPPSPLYPANPRKGAATHQTYHMSPKGLHRGEKTLSLKNTSAQVLGTQQV